jgi:hypothetical protein
VVQSLLAICGKNAGGGFLLTKAGGGFLLTPNKKKEEEDSPVVRSGAHSGLR